MYIATLEGQLSCRKCTSLLNNFEKNQINSLNEQDALCSYGYYKKGKWCNRNQYTFRVSSFSPLRNSRKAKKPAYLPKPDVSLPEGSNDVLFTIIIAIILNSTFSKFHLLSQTTLQWHVWPPPSVQPRGHSCRPSSTSALFLSSPKRKQWFFVLPLHFYLLYFNNGSSSPISSSRRTLYCNIV